MKIRNKISLIFLLITIPILFLGYFFISQLNKIQQPFINNIPDNINKLSETAYLDNLALFIRYYDEVLTQSARNYAFTGDLNWKNRYYEIVPELDENINEAIVKGDDEDVEFFNSINQANIALINMEEEAIILVDNNQNDQAISILNSNSYLQQKDIYQEGLTKYFNKRGYDYDNALINSTKVLEKTTNDSRDLIDRSRNVFLFLITLTILLILLLGYISAYYITKPIIKLENATKELIKGDLNRIVEINSQDEIGQLAQSFNQLIYKLKKTLGSIEIRIKERTEKLDKINKHMIGRELKMKELKNRIKELENK